MQRKNPIVLVLYMTVLFMGYCLLIVAQERDRLRSEANEVKDLVLDNQAPASHEMTMLGLQGMLKQIYDQYREIADLQKEVQDLRRQVEDGPPSATDDLENAVEHGGGSGFF